MKKLVLFCVGTFLSGIVFGQKAFFIYLQTDNQVPFYVRISDKVYSSAVSGFLILPNLTDSTYNLNIGFAKSTAPETRFTITVNQNDKGYLIKNFDDGLGLFDMQTLSIVKPVSSNRANTSYETRTDKFSSILAKAADDPSLLRVAVAKKEEPVLTKVEEKQEVAVVQPEKAEVKETPQTVIPSPDTLTTNTAKVEPDVAKTDTLVARTTVVPEQNNPTPKQDLTVNETTDYTPSVVTRRSESSTTEGFGITYFDSYAGITDTIRILIPPTKNKFLEDSQEVRTEPKRFQLDTVITELVKANDSLVKVGEENQAMNASCKNIASEKDFMKLRKNMAAKDNDEAMVSEAKKAFKSKCYTTEQIRYLSTLFLTSAGKYQFFDGIYEYVAYKEGLKPLHSEIKDEYYLKRFKALVGRVEMARYFIEVAYKGTHYSGFQVQENAITIQSEVEKALYTLHRKPIQLTGSSRTDAGVHALQNYFHFDFDVVHPQAVYKLNAILPSDVAIRNIYAMPQDAHCRFDATSRKYIYRLHTYKEPFLQETSLFFPYRLNLELLQEGALYIKTQENFFAFSKTNTQVNNYRCEILMCDWVQDGSQLYLAIEGNRFLRGMVRLLTATLLKLGREKLSLTDFKNLFGNSQKAGYSVPAHGLFLSSVNYPANYFPTPMAAFTGI